MQLASHSIASILEPNHPSHRTAWLVTGGTAYRAVLHPIATSSETSGGGIVSLYVAPGNASITYDVSVGGFQAGTEIFNVSVVFENMPGAALWPPHAAQRVHVKGLQMFASVASCNKALCETIVCNGIH